MISACFTLSGAQYISRVKQITTKKNSTGGIGKIKPIMNNMKNEFKKVDFSDVCPTITWSFHTLANPESKRPEILRVMIHGTYRKEADREDTHLITVIISAAVSFWNPVYVIIDLSDLEYYGGDEFEKIYDSVDDDDIHTVVLVGDYCRAAMTTLYFGTEKGKDIVDNNFFFDDLNKAIRKLRAQ